MPKKDGRRPSKSKFELKVICDIAKILKALAPVILALIVLKSGGGFPRLVSTPLEASATSGSLFTDGEPRAIGATLQTKRGSVPAATELALERRAQALAVVSRERVCA